MSIRTRIFGPGADQPLLRAKMPKGAMPDMLDSVAVRRAETRRANARGLDRHRLTSEHAILRRGDAEQVVELVNLSVGGAMIRGSQLELMLWDHVGLVLGEGGELDCAVRWIKGDRIGLEFAHETRIDCEDDQRKNLLRAVIRKSFPDLQTDPLGPLGTSDELEDENASEGDPRQAERHPLVWSGVVYHDYEVEPVRLRNISVTGALVQSGYDLPVGDTVYLELEGAGKLEATVRWTRGGQSGLAFTAPFDIHSLADVRPELASRSAAPPEAFGQQEPWAPGWQRATMDQMARNLGG